ncbi:MAG: hypothetical protein IKT54_05265 [Clostridia bacterium]|nr:hypothetical protein [Clostridia bacterium]
MLLTVSEGERGLRQSDAVFQHTVNLPKAFEQLGKISPSAVGVSATPRDVDGSYMPCFLSGIAAATAVGATHGVPLYRFSHQAGHIAAALYSCRREELHHSKFLAFHVSGGTTEITLVDNGKITLLGGTKDISCGKAIDRIGVMMGLKFPCGKELDELSFDPSRVNPGKLSVSGYDFNLSGLENRAEKLLHDGAEKSYIADFVLSHITAVLIKLTENALNEFGKLPIIYAGGVMSNRYINKTLTERFGGLFAESQYSCDNAAGIARLTELKLNGEI